MRVAITGHSRGIGKALFDQYKKKNNSVIGFSKSNGFDISVESTRLNILKICSDFDIFINNAWDYNGQNDLLKKFINHWHGKNDKTIINIGSKSVFVNSDHPYAVSKKELNRTVKSRFFEPFPRIINIIPGVVDTEIAEVINTPYKLCTTDLADFIIMISQYRSPMCVQEIVISHPEEHFPGLDIANI